LFSNNNSGVPYFMGQSLCVSEPLTSTF